MDFAHMTFGLLALTLDFHVTHYLNMVKQCWDLIVFRRSFKSSTTVKCNLGLFVAFVILGSSHEARALSETTAWYCVPLPCVCVPEPRSSDRDPLLMLQVAYFVMNHLKDKISNSIQYTLNLS